MSLAKLYADFHEGVVGEPEVAYALLAENGRVPVEVQLGIYRDGYLIRLKEALRSTYEATAAHMGEAAFDALASRYIDTVPPTSYSLEHYPAGLADFDAALNGFAADLLKLESAIHSSYWCKSMGNLSVRPFSVAVDKHLANQRLALSLSVRVLLLSYPVDRWLKAFREGEQLPVPPQEKNALMVLRVDRVVKRLPLSMEQYALLAALAEGKTVGEAIEVACERGEGAPERVAAGLSGWFEAWVRMGVFVAP